MPEAKKPQDRRPPARKVTASSEKRKQDELDTGVRIKFDGEEYGVRIGDISAPIARRLRREVGCSFHSLMNELGTDPDIDSVAAVIWLSRLIKGDDVTLDEVAVGYGQLDDLDINVAGPEAVDRSPEA